ncbi:sugar efflux transporter C [Escherichia coli]|uniref:Sugar efflux transporter C n=1 Tax=Escherichia coli TaxID=562 RepID=A0A377AIK2_ECOLX|nr:sugar efflux transporter C [Escherichia coli]
MIQKNAKNGYHSIKILDLTAAAFLLVAFLTGIAGALQTPTLSIFLADELKARPIMVGFSSPVALLWDSGQSNFWQGTPINKATVNY